MIGDIVALGYPFMWLFAARRIFSAFRTSEIKTFGADEFDGVGRILGGALALLSGAFWPLIIPIAIVTYRPAKTPEEVKAERDALQVRIRELEAELQMRGAP